MADTVKTRGYRSPVREEQARRTRAAVLEAARRLFTEQGYAATTMSGVAAAAGVALDTVYGAVGTKPVLFRLLLETAISGTDAAVPAEERDYVQRIRQEPRARQKLAVYAAAVAAIGERLGPLHLVLREAAGHSPELAEIRRAIDDRRAAGMRALAQDLVDTGELREDLEPGEVADVLWSMNAPEFRHLLVSARGWSQERFERWLAGTWCLLFLADGEQPRG